MHFIWTTSKKGLVFPASGQPEPPLQQCQNDTEIPNSSDSRTRDPPYISGRLIYADSAFVGLAPPGLAGSWKTENKGYQFWTRANSIGHFCIPNIRPGRYSFLDLLVTTNILLTSTFFQDAESYWELLDILHLEVVQHYGKSLYANVPEKYRQYGLWQRYSELYPDQDLVYTVGHNNYPIDWFFAHVNRNMDNNTYVPTTWKIVFNLDSLDSNGNYTLQLALASANAAELQVRINDKDANTPHFTTGLIGKDNTIARHGIHAPPAGNNEVH
ncbi:lyase [Lithospermum erythrorhizon]|uniref:Lyase n=1 Tax=Lithospermum erythrorhizon TaxID=34254 RepID=A0AAV3R1G0_LITER